MRIPILLGAILLLQGTISSACEVPVFRYALERWHADRYELAIFTKDPLEVEIPKFANIDLTMINVDEMGPNERAVYGAIDLKDGASLMRLYYPEDVGIDGPIWEAPYSAENLAKVIDSPARRTIRENVLAGESAVWLIVDGDAALEKKLVGQLKAVAETLEISDAVIGPGNLDRVASGEIEIEDVLRSTIPLKISFETLTIQRDDPAEEVFIKMLFGVSQEALERFPDSPLLFPVFGRGRCIDGVPTKFASDQLLREACEYLCGACSCEVKKENPGIDLIMNADWDSLIAGSEVVIEKELPPLSGAGDFDDEAPEVVTVVDEPKAAEKKPSRLLGQAFVVAVVFVLGIAIFSAFAAHSKGRGAA